MAKKRGGLAGVWDRNKGVIKKVAPIAAGFIPGVGPAVGAALGAAMGGLDRPGKGGIGLDVGGAVKGGISGYGGAKLGQAAKGGLGRLFTAQGSDPATQPFGGDGFNPFKKAPSIDVAAKSPVGALNTPTDFADIEGIGSKFVTAMPAGSPPMMSQTLLGAPPASANKYLDAAKKAGGYFERNQQMLGGVAKGVGSVLGSRAEGDAMAARTDLDRQRFEYEKQQDETEQERRRRIAELLMPMFGQMQTSYGG